MNGARGRGHDDHDVYDGPRSPTKRLKKNHGPWRPWDVSGGSSNPGTVIHVSTPDWRTETNARMGPPPHRKQQATPQRKPNLSLVFEGLRTEPENGLSLDELIDWLRTHYSAVYQECDEEKLRRKIKATLNQQTSKTNPTLWLLDNGKWQVGKALVPEPRTRETTEKEVHQHGRTPRATTPSAAWETPDGASETREDVPRSELQQTLESQFANSQNTPPSVQAASTPAILQTQPSDTSPVTDALIDTENLASNAAAPNRPSEGKLSSDHDGTVTQIESAAASVPPNTHNEPSNTLEDRAPADSSDGSTQHDQNEPDYGKIVRKLHLLKDKRVEQEQKIKDAQAVLPEISSLIQSANEAEHAAREAQRAADEAHRVADEAHRVADTTKKAVEDAQAEKSQLTAHELQLQKFEEEFLALRAQLRID